MAHDWSTTFQCFIHCLLIVIDWAGCLTDYHCRLLLMWLDSFSLLFLFLFLFLFFFFFVYWAYCSLQESIRYGIPITGVKAPSSSLHIAHRSMLVPHCSLRVLESMCPQRRWFSACWSRGSLQPMLIAPYVWECYNTPSTWLFDAWSQGPLQWFDFLSFCISIHHSVNRMSRCTHSFISVVFLLESSLPPATEED